MDAPSFLEDALVALEWEDFTAVVALCSGHPLAAGNDDERVGGFPPLGGRRCNGNAKVAAGRIFAEIDLQTMSCGRNPRSLQGSTSAIVWGRSSCGVGWHGVEMESGHRTNFSSAHQYFQHLLLTAGTASNDLDILRSGNALRRT